MSSRYTHQQRSPSINTCTKQLSSINTRLPHLPHASQMLANNVSTHQVKQYVKEFHPRLLGLTGTPDKVWVHSVDNIEWTTRATGQGCCQGIPRVLQQDG